MVTSAVLVPFQDLVLVLHSLVSSPSSILSSIYTNFCTLQYLFQLLHSLVSSPSSALSSIQSQFCSLQYLVLVLLSLVSFITELTCFTFCVIYHVTLPERNCIPRLHISNLYLILFRSDNAIFFPVSSFLSIDAIGVSLSASDLHVIYERFGRTDADHVDYESFCYLVDDCNRSLSLALDNRSSRDSKYKPLSFLSVEHVLYNLLNQICTFYFLIMQQLLGTE